MNINSIEEAAKKAENMMNAKYGKTWLNVNTNESGEEVYEIKPEYFDEYDKYYESFLWN